MADHVTCPTLNYQASSYFEETLTRKYIHSPKTIFEKFRWKWTNCCCHKQHSINYGNSENKKIKSEGNFSIVLPESSVFLINERCDIWEAVCDDTGDSSEHTRTDTGHQQPGDIQALNHHEADIDNAGQYSSHWREKHWQLPGNKFSSVYTLQWFNSGWSRNWMQTWTKSKVESKCESEHE